jgi:hypothetical protein
MRALKKSLISKGAKKGVESLGFLLLFRYLKVELELL